MVDETKNSQTPSQEPENPEEGNPQGQEPENPEEGTGQEGTPEKKTTPAEGESSSGNQEDFQKKFSESSKEAQRLYQENKKLKTQLEGSNPSGEAPSEQELAKAVPNWDMLDSSTQQLWKDHIMLKRQMANLNSTVSTTSKQLKWEEQFNEITKHPTIGSTIQQKKAEFKEFCGEREPTEELAKAFLFDDAKNLGASEEKEKLSRPGLEGKSGGERAPSQPEMSVEERETLRQNDPEKYKKLIREGKINP